jgi:hypothetical protein
MLVLLLLSMLDTMLQSSHVLIASGMLRDRKRAKADADAQCCACFLTVTSATSSCTQISARHDDR